jgi:hypothetical protein
MRVLHYPPQDSKDVGDKVLGIGAHTEYAFLVLCTGLLLITLSNAVSKCVTHVLC